MSSVKKYNLNQITFDCDVMMTYQIPYDTHPEVVINRAKFDAFTSSSFGEVKAHICTYVHMYRQNCAYVQLHL